MSTDRYEDVVFIDRDYEAEEPFRILDEEGEEAALEYLKQWHSPGHHMTRDKLPHGTRDDTFSKDGYHMAWNRGLGYIGLTYDTAYAPDDTDEERAERAGVLRRRNPLREYTRQVLNRAGISKELIDLASSYELTIRAYPNADEDMPGMGPAFSIDTEHDPSVGIFGGSIVTYYPKHGVHEYDVDLEEFIRETEAAVDEPSGVRSDIMGLIEGVARALGTRLKSTNPTARDSAIAGITREYVSQVKTAGRAVRTAKQEVARVTRAARKPVAPTVTQRKPAATPIRRRKPVASATPPTRSPYEGMTVTFPTGEDIPIKYFGTIAGTKYVVIQANDVRDFGLLPATVTFESQTFKKTRFDADTKEAMYAIERTVGGSPESAVRAAISSVGARRMKGNVKWWNDSKGYGFIEAPGYKDIFAHYSGIVMEGFKTLEEGAPVEFDLIEGPKGPQAANIVQIGGLSTERKEEKSHETLRRAGVDPREQDAARAFDEGKRAGFAFANGDKTIAEKLVRDFEHWLKTKRYKKEIRAAFDRGYDEEAYRKGREARMKS